MNLKSGLIIVADKLDRIGLQKEANIIDVLLKTASENKDLQKALEDALLREEDDSIGLS